MTTARLVDLPGLRTFRSTRFRLAVGLLLLAGAVATYSVNATVALPDMTDLKTFRTAALLLFSNHTPYGALSTPVGDTILADGRHIPYPPTFFALLGPILALPVVPGRLAWLALEQASLAVIVGGVYAGIGRPPGRELVWVGAAVLFFEPLRASVYYGQTGLLLTALLVLAILASQRGHPVVAGLALGIAAGIKVTPLVLLLYFAWRRRWSLVATCLLTILGLVALTYLVGLGHFWGEYLSFVRPFERGTPLVDNQSLNGLVLRILGPQQSGQPIGPLPLATEATWYLLEAALAGLVGLAIWSSRGRTLAAQEWHLLAFLLLALPLLEPFAWDHHWVFAIPAIVVAGRAIHGGAWRGRRAAILVGCYLLVSFFGYPLVHLGKEVGVASLHLHRLVLVVSSVFFAAGLAAMVAFGPTVD